MEKMVEVRGLYKRYEQFALDGVSFDVPKGYITGFIGPNGAGKTTTLKALLGMNRYEAGEIGLFGEAASPVLRHNHRIGVVMDAPFYVDDWRPKDVEAAVAPFYPRWEHEGFVQFLDTFGISQDKRLKELSRGMKVKLMMAVALSHQAELLILDEPTSGLDPVAREEMCDLLRAFMQNENKGVLFSTHITEDLERIADYIIFIMEGRIVFSGPKEALLEKYALVKGGRSELREEDEGILMGLRQHPTGFEAMVELANVPQLPKSLLMEPATLEEIIIFMNREAKQHG